MNYKNETLIITGGLGFIGKNFYNYIKNFFGKVIIFDKNTYAADYKFVKNVLRKNDEIVLGDICIKKDLNNVIQNGYYLVHFAAESHVDRSYKNSLKFSRVNLFGTHNLLEYCRHFKLKKIIICSTDEVYGESFKKKNEKSLLRPTNPYSASKAAADLMSQTYILSYKLPICIIRPNNVYGIRQKSEKIIPAIASSINNDSILKIHGNGTNVRHFLHVTDLSKAIKLILDKSPIHEIYNIGGKEKHTINNLIKLALKISNKKNNNLIEYVEDRPFNDKVYSIDSSKIKKLGWREKSIFKKEFKYIIQNKSYLK